MKSADLEGTPGPDGSPVYLTYDNRASYVDMYAELAGLEFINLCHQGDATAQMVSRAADFATMNTTGCTKWGMLIGTNDANTSVTTTVYGTNLSSIIDSFVGAAPVNSVILTSHIFSPTNKDITGYNGQIDSTAPTKQTANPNYLFPVADFATTANLVLNANPGGDMQDALHLNSTGAAKIRDALPAMFASVVPGSPSQPGAATGNVQITLTWLAVTNATAYEVYRDGVTKIFDGNALTYTDNVAGGSTHSYTVKAKNGLGTSAPSAGRSIAANVGGGGGGGAGGAAGGRLSIGL
jgi:lysophospholipase L1-like esterase